MARLPKPGGDEEVWAKLLNEYLLVAHNADGTPRKTTLEALAATVGLSDLRTKNAASEPLKGLLLSNDGTDLIWKKPPLDVSVTDFGAVGDGVTDDTDAVQAAIDTAKDGGAIVFPRGVYMVRGLKLKAHGTQLMGGARWGTRIVRLSGTAPLVDMSGTGTLNKHLKYCSLFNVMLSGNGLPGVLVRSYYSDNHIFLNTSFIHCKGLSVDFVEAWDARFDNCSWEDCGSVEEPAVLFRNSTRAGTFGYGTDSTNQIHFVGCRWEGWRNGALKLDGGANDSPSLLNGVFFTACKMETRYAAGPALPTAAARACRARLLDAFRSLARLQRGASHGRLRGPRVRRGGRHVSGDGRGRHRILLATDALRQSARAGHRPPRDQHGRPRRCVDRRPLTMQVPLRLRDITPEG